MTRIIGEPDGATLLDPDEMEGLKFKAIKTRGQRLCRKVSNLA